MPVASELCITMQTTACLTPRHSRHPLLRPNIPCHFSELMLTIKMGSQNKGLKMLLKARTLLFWMQITDYQRPWAHRCGPLLWKITLTSIIRWPVDLFLVGIMVDASFLIGMTSLQSLNYLEPKWRPISISSINLVHLFTYWRTCYNIKSLIINGHTELALESSCATLLITPPVCCWSSIWNPEISRLSSTAYTMIISTPAIEIRSFNPFGNQNPNFKQCPKSPPPLMYSPLPFMRANPTSHNILTRCHVLLCHGMWNFQSKQM